MTTVPSSVARSAVMRTSLSLRSVTSTAVSCPYSMVSATASPSRSVRYTSAVAVPLAMNASVCSSSSPRSSYERVTSLASSPSEAVTLPFSLVVISPSPTTTKAVSEPLAVVTTTRDSLSCSASASDARPTSTYWDSPPASTTSTPCSLSCAVISAEPPTSTLARVEDWAASDVSAPATPVTAESSTSAPASTPVRLSWSDWDSTATVSATTSPSTA